MLRFKLLFIAILVVCGTVFVWLNTVNNSTTNNHQQQHQSMDMKQTSHGEDLQDVNRLVVLINRQLNQEQFIWNSANKGQDWQSTGQVGSIVIVVQVHNRPALFQKLIESLSRAKWIDRALLVFSHDIYSDELNHIVRSISFAAGVVQIFYPHSFQLFPNIFPGQSPFDCPRYIGSKKAEELNCSNLAHPDNKGQYREANICQSKHHWWWKANYIFNGHLRTLKDYHGPVLFLEEDHWLAEDFLHVLGLQQRLMSQYTNVRILSLGCYDLEGDEQQFNQVNLVQWINTKHNIVKAFNRTMWQEFQRCSDTYCSFDDYNVITNL